MDTRQKSEIAFKEFLELIQKLTSHDKDLHRKLQKSYDQTNPHFRWSRGFINLVSLSSEKIRDTPEKRLLHVKEFINELQNYKAKPLKHLIKNASCVSDSDDSSTEELPTSPKLSTTESSKVISVMEMEVDGNSENKSEGHSDDGSVDGQGLKRKKSSSDGPEEQNVPSTGNEAESRKKKRMFYNSTSLSGLMTTSYPRMGYMRKPRSETSSAVAAAAATDIICLDDDDDDHNDNDDDDVEGGLSSEKADFDKSVDVNQEKGESLLKATDSSIHSSIITFKPCPVLAKRDDAVGIGTNHLKTNADALHGGNVEVICLDDEDDDDDVVDNKKIGKSDRQPLEIGSIPVRGRPVDTALLARARVDPDVIEITDADDNQSQEKLLPSSGQTEKQSSVEAENEEEAATQQVPEIHSNTLCMDCYDDNSNEAVETGVNVDTKARDAVEDGDTSIEVQSSKLEMLLNNRPVDCDRHASDEKTLERQINHLEHQLQKLSAEIQRLRETELTLDDMNSDESDYINADRLERKFLEVWKKLCKILHCPAFSEKRFSVEISGYPDIGKAVSDFINKDDRLFPDYQDIYDIVVSSNDKCSLLLTDATVRCLSENIFTHVGNRLQQLRKIDLAEQMKTYQPDTVRSYDDPAIYDKDLIEKLEESQAVGRKNLEQIFKSFSEKQERNGDTTVDTDENKALDEDDADDADEDDEDDEDDSEDERDNNEDVLMQDLEPSSEVEPSSEAKAYSDLELSKSMFETKNDHGTDEDEDDDDDDDERSCHKEIIFINFDDGSGKADENTAATRSVTRDGRDSIENDCKKAEDPTPSSLNACRSIIVIDEESDANNKEATNSASSNKQHILKSSQLKIRSELLDNIRRLTSNISFSEASSLSQSDHETSVYDETDEKKTDGKQRTDATPDRREMDVEESVVLHSKTMNADLYEEQRELTATRSDVNISNHESRGKEEDEKDPTNSEFMEFLTTTRQKASCKETAVWKQDSVEKMSKAEVDIVHREDVNVSETNDVPAVTSLSSNCAPNVSTEEMSSDPCPAAAQDPCPAAAQDPCPAAAGQEASACSLVDVVVTTTFISNALMLPECLDVPLLEELSQATDSSTSMETEKASLSAETTTEVRAVLLPVSDGEQQGTSGALSLPEAAAELKVKLSDVSQSTVEPTIIVSAAEEVSYASDLTTEQMSLFLDSDAVQTNDEFDFPLDLFHSSNVLDDMVQSQCSSKSNVEDLFPDEICSTSDLDLRLDTSSESPDDPQQVSRSSSVADIKKPNSDDVPEKSKGLLDVLREASKRELLAAEASSPNPRNSSSCEDSISQLEMDEAHMEEEEGFSRQQLHLKSERRTISSSYSPASEQTLHSSHETDLLLPEKQFSVEPPIHCELHAGRNQCEDKMCKDEHHNRPVSLQCKENVLQVDQNSKPGNLISTVQSEDTISSQSKENIIELDSDLE